MEDWEAEEQEFDIREAWKDYKSSKAKIPKLKEKLQDAEDTYRIAEAYLKQVGELE